MRSKLKSVVEKRLRFRAEVERFGTKPGYRGSASETTVLLKNVVFADNGRPATDHIWFTVGKMIAAQRWEIGDRVEFDARVGEYAKGYVNYREYIDERVIDYKLNRPTRFAKCASPAD